MKYKQLDFTQTKRMGLTLCVYRNNSHWQMGSNLFSEATALKSGAFALPVGGLPSGRLDG